jgi:glycerate kinase
MPRDVVIVAAQAFKETLSAAEVAAAFTRALASRAVAGSVFRCSDGGDGLLDALGPRLRERTIHATTDPLGRPVTAEIGWLADGGAVVESRLACGLALLGPGERKPLVTSTRGVGTLVSAAAFRGAGRVFVGLGGSATMDGGAGMARAWGWVPAGPRGELPEGGGALADLEQFDPGRRPEVELVGLCDVRNPLTGPQGAVLFARQKGASAAAEARLAQGLERLVRVTRGEQDAARPGAGAAGGLGFGLVRFGGGTLQSGAAWFLDRTGFDRDLRAARLVVACEGRFDRTSLGGKLTGEVIARARAGGVPVLLVAPAADDVPEGVTVASGPGRWTVADLEARAGEGIERALGLSGR